MKMELTIYWKKLKPDYELVIFKLKILCKNFFVLFFKIADPKISEIIELYERKIAASQVFQREFLLTFFFESGKMLFLDSWKAVAWIGCGQDGGVASSGLDH